MISMDKLHGIFRAYEMRKKQENSSRKEAKFKESKKTKNNKKKLKSDYSYNNDSNKYEDMDNFIRKLKK